MRKTLTGLVIGLAMFIIFLVVTLPAQFMVPRLIPSHLEKTLAIDDISGSVWRGQAGRVAAFNFDFGSARWVVLPATLTSGRINSAILLRRTGFTIVGELATDFDRNWSLTDMQGTIPLADLSATDHFLPGVEGKANFDIETLKLVNLAPVEVVAEVSILNLRLAWIPGLDLGDYRANVNQSGESVVATLTDTRGPLNVELDLVFTPGGGNYQYEISGYVHPRPGTELHLASALQWLGTPDNNGRYSINLAGRIRQ